MINFIKTGLLYVKEQIPKLYKIPIQQMGIALYYILFFYIIQCNTGNIFYYVKEQTPELGNLIIHQTCISLKYIKTHELCKMAIQQIGYILQYVKEQTHDLCEMTVKYNGYILQYVNIQKVYQQPRVSLL